MAETLSPRRVRQLADLRPEQGRVLSVYVDFDPSEFSTPPARASLVTSVVTDARHRVEELEDLSHDERKALREDVESVRDALSRPGVADDGARGVAVFACGPAGLLETVRVPYALPTRVVVGEAPFVDPLVVSGGRERWLVLLANRRSARLFVGVPPELEETDRIDDSVHSQHDQGGWSQARYQRAVEEDVRDHLENAVGVAFDLYKRRGFDRLVLGAPQETVADLERHLHPYLRERLAGTVRLDVENASLDDVRAAAAEQRDEHEAQREAEALDRVRQGVGSGGRAAAGRDEVMGALEQARVETLLIADGTEADEAIERALESGAQVMVVRHHAEDLGPLGGIAAVLRY